MQVRRTLKLVSLGVLSSTGVAGLMVLGSVASSAPTGAAGSQLVASSDNNWAGVAAEDVKAPDIGGASATWTVPSVTCSPKENSASAVWVGIGGGPYPPTSKKDEALYQDGTDSYCVKGVATYDAWQQQAGPDNLLQEVSGNEVAKLFIPADEVLQHIDSKTVTGIHLPIPVHAGDTVHASTRTTGSTPTGT